MQPSEPPQHPIDYLDSISSVPKGSGKKVSDKVFFGVIIAAVLTTLLIGAFAFLNKGTGSKEDLSRLGIRLNNLQVLADTSQRKIVSSKLRAINTSLSLVLTNANRDITEPLTANTIDLTKLSPKITADENTDELQGRLEDARLNAVFDRTYAREITYQLDTLLVLLERMEAKTKKNSVKDFLSATMNDLKPLQKQFSDFNASTS